jgi:hypothetical protein
MMTARNFADEDHLRLSQWRGRERQAGAKTQRDIIFELMEGRVMRTSELVAATGWGRQTVIGSLNRLRAEKRIRFVGKVAFGFHGRKENAYEHGAEDEGATSPIRRRMRKPRAAAGSGVIAGRIEIGRGFKWGAGLA